MRLESLKQLYEVISKKMMNYSSQVGQITSPFLITNKSLHLGHLSPVGLYQDAYLHLGKLSHP